MVAQCDVGKDRIRGNTQDLGVDAGKPGEIRLDCRQFVLSNRSEIQRVETDDYVFATLAGEIKFAL